MSYWYQIKTKIWLITVNTFYFNYRNALINFMVSLFIWYKLKLAISFNLQLHLYLPDFRMLIFGICGENIQGVKIKLLQFFKINYLNIGDINSEWPTFKSS